MARVPRHAAGCRSTVLDGRCRENRGEDWTRDFRLGKEATRSVEEGDHRSWRCRWKREIGSIRRKTRIDDYIDSFGLSQGRRSRRSQVARSTGCHGCRRFTTPLATSSMAPNDSTAPNACHTWKSNGGRHDEHDPTKPKPSTIRTNKESSGSTTPVQTKKMHPRPQGRSESDEQRPTNLKPIATSSSFPRPLSCRKPQFSWACDPKSWSAHAWHGNCDVAYLLGSSQKCICSQAGGTRMQGIHQDAPDDEPSTSQETCRMQVSRLYTPSKGNTLHDRA